MPYYVVVNDPVGAQPSSIANNLWTNQDIASPGDASGDGNVDNAQIPIRMILRPGNPGTSYAISRLEWTYNRNV